MGTKAHRLTSGRVDSRLSRFPRSRHIDRCLIVAAPFLSILACGPAEENRREAETTRYEDLGSFVPQTPDSNVIIVSFDALRADALGIYGSPLGASPHIDAFAERSLVFEQAYSAGQATPSSFASAFTGRYPFHVFRKWQLSETETLALVFQRAGYQTAGFFNNSLLDAKRNFNQGFEEYQAVLIADEEKFLELPTKWLRENRNERLFVWIHFISPHPPYTYREMAAKFYSPDYQGRFKGGSGSLRDVFEIEDPLEVARLKELYTGGVFYADALFGRLQLLLSELGLLEKSVVIVTADHGEEIGDHGVIAHRQVYEEVIRLPLIIYHPHVRNGHRTRTPYINLDLLPTLTSMVGIDYPSGLDGVNLLGDYPKPRGLLSTAMTNRNWRSMGLRFDDYKLITACPPETRQEKLYDLATDPGEEHDLVQVEPEVAGRMLSLMQYLAQGDPCDVIVNAVKGATIVDGMDEKRIQELRALGYVQ